MIAIQTFFMYTFYVLKMLVQDHELIFPEKDKYVKIQDRYINIYIYKFVYIEILKQLKDKFNDPSKSTSIKTMTLGLQNNFIHLDNKQKSKAAC